MTVDGCPGSVRLELQDLVGEHWPANGRVLVQSIPGGVEITWQTATQNRVATTSTLRFLLDIRYTGAGWNLYYVEPPGRLPETPQLPNWAVCAYVLQEWSLA